MYICIYDIYNTPVFCCRNTASSSKNPTDGPPADQGFRTAFLDPNGLLNTMPTDIVRWGAFIQRTFWEGKVGILGRPKNSGTPWDFAGEGIHQMILIVTSENCHRYKYQKGSSFLMAIMLF